MAMDYLKVLDFSFKNLNSNTEATDKDGKQYLDDNEVRAAVNQGCPFLKIGTTYNEDQYNDAKAKYDAKQKRKAQEWFKQFENPTPGVQRIPTTQVIPTDTTTTTGLFEELFGPKKKVTKDYENSQSSQGPTLNEQLNRMIKEGKVGTRLNINY